MNLNELVDLVADAWGVPPSTVTIQVTAEKAVVRSRWESAPLVEVCADGKTSRLADGTMSTLDGWIQQAAARRLAEKAVRLRETAAQLAARSEWHETQAQRADARARQIDPGYGDPRSEARVDGEVVGHAAPVPYQDKVGES